MNSTTLALVFCLCLLNSALLVDAGLYVIKPSRGWKCHGGQECTLEWLDDGIRPLLSAIGVCSVGLFTGKQQLVQELAPVDVSRNHSITFTPNPHTGPNSDTYYISIISTSFRQTDNTAYIAFSPFFSIDQMTGSFQSPLVGSAISTKPFPSSLDHSPSSTGSTGSILSTITVGTLSTSLPALHDLSSTQPLSTSTTTPASSSSPTRMAISRSPFASPSSPPSSSSLPASLITGTGTAGLVTGSGTSPLAPPAFTSATSGALPLFLIPTLGVLSLPIVLPFLF